MDVIVDYPHIVTFQNKTRTITVMASIQDQGDTTVIRHGLQYGKLPDEVKLSLIARGQGQPLTQVLKKYMPSDGIGAYPCLVLDPSTGEIQGSMWSLRGAMNWNTGYKACNVWGKEAKDYSLVLNIPNESIQFPGDTMVKCFSRWQDAFLSGWAQIVDNQGAVLQDISNLKTISE